MSTPWLKRYDQYMTLQIKVKPGSKKNAISIDLEGGLQISLQASAQDGKANKMLIQYLAKALRLQQKQIDILRGTTSRLKLLSLKVRVAEQEELIQALEVLAKR